MTRVIRLSRQSPQAVTADAIPRLPLFVRKRIAARMRANSKEANSSKSLAIMDVNQNAVVSAMEKHQVQWLIHGHTHRPAVHELIANQQPAFPRRAGCGIRKVRW